MIFFPKTVLKTWNKQGTEFFTLISCIYNLYSFYLIHFILTLFGNIERRKNSRKKKSKTNPSWYLYVERFCQTYTLITLGRQTYHQTT